MAIDPKLIVKRDDDLRSLNQSWRVYFQDLATFCLPRKAFINRQRVTGEKLQFHRVYDTTAIRALLIMAAGFHSNLTNPSTKWFELRTKELDFMKIKEVQLWFKNAEDKIFSTFNSSNFDTTMQEFYIDAGCFGTGSVFIQEDLQDIVRYTTIPIEQLGLEEDSQGRVQKVYRKFIYTVWQAWSLWGNQAGEVVVKKFKDGKLLDKVDFIHFVGPRDKRDPGKIDSLNMPFESIWIEVSKQEKIREGGFQENPYAVGRFYKRPDEVFGFSPAMNTLNDIKLVNEVKRTLIRAAQKIVDPPLMVPSKGFILPLNLNPAAMNYRNKETSKDDLQPIMTKANLPIGFEFSDVLQRDIEKHFFVPLFQAFADITKTMTIPEVQRRISENMVLLGPVVGRFTQELLDPVVLRTFAILFRRGELPPPPQVIQGQELDVIYTSQLAKAQRETEIFSIESFLNDVGAIAQVIPNVIDKIDGDKAVDIIADVKGVNPDIIRDDKNVVALRQQRAEQEAAVAQAEQIAQGAETAKTLSEAQSNAR